MKVRRTNRTVSEEITSNTFYNTQGAERIVKMESKGLDILTLLCLTTTLIGKGFIVNVDLTISRTRSRYYDVVGIRLILMRRLICCL